MKTHTEIFGPPLREIYGWRWELIQARRQEKRSGRRNPPLAPMPQEQPATPSPPAEPETATPEIQEAQPTSEPVTTQAPAEEVSSEPLLPKDHIKNADERLADLKKREEEETERRQKSWQQEVGEIREALVTKVREKFQWSDERIDLAILALDSIDRKQVHDLYRILVLKPEKENEPFPRNGQKRGEFVFVTEYLPSKFRPEREERGGRQSGKDRGKGSDAKKRGRSRRPSKEGFGQGPRGNRSAGGPPGAPGSRPAGDGRRPPLRRGGKGPGQSPGQDAKGGGDRPFRGPRRPPFQRQNPVVERKAAAPSGPPPNPIPPPKKPE